MAASRGLKQVHCTLLRWFFYALLTFFNLRVCNCEKLAWFLCVGSPAEVTYMLFLQVALESGLQTSSDDLFPIVLIGRNPEHIPNWLLALNRTRTALVLNHNTTFEYSIAKHAEDKKLSEHGAYLRLDIPVLIGRIARYLPFWDVHVRTDVAFYTDCDVMVLNVRNTMSIAPPPLLGMGPEVNKGHVFNTGVLFMNIANFSAARPGLIAYANEHKWLFGGCDQGLINDYFKDQRSLIPDEYNWKPYWGVNKNAFVIHFHGPKLGRCIECLVKHRFLPDVNHSSLCGCVNYNKALTVSRNKYHLSYDQQMQSYSYYMQKFYKYLFEFGERLTNIGYAPAPFPKSKPLRAVGRPVNKKAPIPATTAVSQSKKPLSN